MRNTLAAIVVAASLLSVASSEASAWVCRAVGIGSGGYGRSFSVIDAKLIALRRCENTARSLFAPSCGVAPADEAGG